MENREWKEYILSDVIDKFIDYRGRTPKKTDFGIPLITAKVVKNGRLLEPNEFIAEEDYEDWMTRGFPKFNDVILTSEAPLGEVALVKDEKIALAQRIITLQTNKDICNSIFLKYYFQSYIGQNALQSRASGSTVEGIKSAELKKVEIQLPLLPEQKAIASVLSSLDDKIDLLHQQNQTLEALAETLFRQWFIVEAKEDWEDCTIGDLAIHSKISVHPKKNPDILYYHYSIPAFDSNKKPVVEFGKEIQSNKYKVEENSILFSKLNPHKDKRVWLIQDSVEEHAICSTELQVVKPKDNDYLYFIYGWLTNSIYYNEIAAGVGGTSGSHQRIEPKAIFSAPCVKIDKNIIHQYNILAEPLFKKQFENQQQIQTLTKLRDTLLPKLMSGEVRVKN